MFKKKLNNLKMLFIISIYSAAMYAQDNPFNCDYNAYLFQYNDVYALDLASGSSYQVGEDIVEGRINAAGYNAADGFIWGTLSTPSKSIVRIGKDFSTTTYTIDELSSAGLYVGDVNSEGVYFVKGAGATYYKIDLDPESESYAQHLATEDLTLDINIHDWSFNAVDNQLYTVEQKTNILYRINPTNGQVEALGEVPILSGLTYTYGAVYFDSEGRFYISANQTGTIYMIRNVQDIETVFDIDANFFAFGPSSSSNDGARCPTAPVQQEICDNGVDDDGDGLVDCDDPSCSGYGVCEIITPPTSGSNSGGLESNSRLSEQINARNFQRAKNSYKFDSAKAKRVKRNESYATRDPESGLSLENFVPLNCIHEDEAIEASPTDLINITNATEVYSVDYLKDSKSVASVLALKTESGVYEHTKYICDRLLGAELISVSTLIIKDQEFIKSIIKNEDGTFEFVLSFSAQVAKDEGTFMVESHWNLDKYKKDVTYYNFQIWSNSIDDLYTLGSEVLKLLEVQKPISRYENSSPPNVFVRKGKYNNGSLELEIVNNNRTESVFFEAGLRSTETADFESMSSVIELSGDHITRRSIRTDNIFDIGFRIGDGIGTPDDLFLSDGPWGIDASRERTTVSKYNIVQNDFEFDAEDFAIERNVELSATTDSYVATYRALTPRYKAVDLTGYNSLNLSAQGTGTMEITLVKECVENWDEQYKTYIELTEDMKDYSISISDFSSHNQDEIELNDVVTMVFTLVSETGEIVTRSMELQDIRFTNEFVLSAATQDSELKKVMAYPNPMSSSTSIKFYTDKSEDAQLVIFDQLGKRIFQKNFKSVVGENNINVLRQDWPTGIYFAKILGTQNLYKPIKLIVK